MQYSVTKLLNMIRALRKEGASRITVSPNGSVSVEFSDSTPVEERPVNIDPAFWDEFIGSEKNNKGDC